MKTIEVSLSKESIELLSESLKNPISEWGGLLTAIAALITTYFAYQAIKQNQETHQELLVQDIHRQFFDINRDWANRQEFTQHDYELLANFVDRVAETDRKEQD